jgi:hypothetical protein
LTNEDIVYENYTESRISEVTDGNRRFIKRVTFSHFVWNLYNHNNTIKKYDGCVIHHKDGNKLNDHIYNLEKVLGVKHSYDHNIGKRKSEETKEKISNNRKGKCLGKDNHFYGKKHTEHTKKLQSIVKKGKCKSEETKRKLSESMKLYWKNLKEENLSNV